MTAVEPTLLKPCRVRDAAGWKLVEFAEVTSTNLVAATFAAWQAARADTQTAGRGRFQRTWVSDRGGLWLSAVVPLSADAERNQTLPLVAGLAVIEALRPFGVADLRLRWPNDIMAGTRKLAGLLVDSFSPQLAVVGIGVNVQNEPAACDPALRTTATRLADLVAPAPPLDSVTDALLASLRRAVEEWLAAGFDGLSRKINRAWGGHREVRLDLDGVQRTGLFLGVDAQGRLVLDTGGGVARRYGPHEVKLLREI